MFALWLTPWPTPEFPHEAVRVEFELKAASPVRYLTRLPAHPPNSFDLHFH